MKRLAGSVSLFTVATLLMPRKGAFMHMNIFTQQLLLFPRADRESGSCLIFSV